MKKSFKLLLSAGALSLFVLVSCGQKNQDTNHDGMDATHQNEVSNGNPQDVTGGNSGSMDVDSTKEYGEGMQREE